MKKLLIKFWPLLLILPAFIFIILPVLHDGLFNVYDNVQVTRTMAVYDEIKVGQFPVRFFGAFGHGAGYFLLKYYSPLVYYLGAFFHTLGFSFIKSIKLVYLAALLPGALGSFVLIYSLGKHKLIASLGTIAFLLAPYLYHDFYHRGSLTEAAAFMVLPWVLWSFLSLKKKRSLRFLTLSALSLGVCLITHSLTGFMVIALVLALAVIPPLNFKFIAQTLAAILLAIGLSAFTILPAFLDKGLVQYTGNSLVERGYLDHPVPFWRNFLPERGGESKIAFLGFPLFLGYFLLLFLLWRSPRFRKEQGTLAYWVVLVMTGGFFIMSPVSAWVWAHVESLRYTQFPFRFLTVVTIAGVIGYSLIAAHLIKSKIIVSLLGLLVLLQILLYPHFYEPLSYQYGTDYKVEDPCMTTGWANEHLPIWVKQCLKAPLELAIPLDKNVTVQSADNLDNGRTVRLTTSGTGSVQIAKYFFPNWVSSGSQKLEPYGDNGLIKLTVNGNSTVTTLRYLETPLEQTSDWISIASGLLILYTLWYGYRH